MSESVFSEFGGAQPKVIVLDDDDRARKMTSRRFKKHGYAVTECASKEEFDQVWKPGLFDLIVADWQLAQDAQKHGDKVLADVRERDWDVPFVLISGRLEDDDLKAPVLQELLDQGGAKFISRGDSAIEQACEQGGQLIERRDSTLLKVLLSLREAAERDLSIRTPAGSIRAIDQVAELVAKPSSSHDALRPATNFKSRAFRGAAG